MSNTDFRLAVGIFENKKIVKLQRRLGDSGVLAHIRLLRYTSVNHPSGNLGRVDHEDIAIMAGWAGAEDFAGVLKELPLLDVLMDGSIYVHDWEEHNPWACGAERRSEIARNAANKRHARTQEVVVVHEACSEHAGSMQGAMPLSYPILSDSESSPNPSLTDPKKDTNALPVAPPAPPVGGTPPEVALTTFEVEKGRSFPPKEPAAHVQPKHLLWCVEMVNEALIPGAVIGKEVKAASELLRAGYTEQEIMEHYRTQRDRADRPYSLFLLQSDIPSLHGRKVNGRPPSARNGYHVNGRPPPDDGRGVSLPDRAKQIADELRESMGIRQ